MARILVIDDEENFRFMLRRKLEKEGYDVLEAADGEGGKRVFLAEHPDLIITDLVMPEKEGIEFIMELKKEAPRFPVIAISGGGRGDPHVYLGLAKDLGARHTFEKPLDWEPFREAVKALVA